MSKSESFVHRAYSQLYQDEKIAAFYRYSVRQYHRKIRDGVEFLEPISERENERIFGGQVTAGIHRVALPKCTYTPPGLVTPNTPCVRWKLCQPFEGTVAMLDGKPGQITIICRGDYGLSGLQP